MFPSLFIFCDAADHPRKRVPVTNFMQTPAGWHEVPASKASTETSGAGSVGTGRQMVNDLPAEVGWSLDPAITASASRVRFELQCRRCRFRVVLNADSLHATLDGFIGAGLDEVALSMLGASMGRKHQR